MATYETIGGIPTQGITYLKMLDHIRELQTAAATMSHLVHTESGPRAKDLAMGWLTIAENMKMMERYITKLAQGRMS